MIADVSGLCCTVCGKQPNEHGSYPTCASHPYNPDGRCGHVGIFANGKFTGVPCAGVECKNGCAAARGVPGGIKSSSEIPNGSLAALRVPTPVPAAPFGTNVPELLAAADALLRTAPPEPDWVEEVRELLGEAYRFQSTSPRAQENISAALELIDRHAAPAAPKEAQEPVAWRREWDGDESDLGHWLYTEDESDTKDGYQWQPLYASLPPAVRLSDEEIMAHAIRADVVVDMGGGIYGPLPAGRSKLLAFAHAVLSAASAPKTEGNGNAET